jgi:enoyl-CoA hydratase/carnithine racemase
MDELNWATLRVRRQGRACFVQIHRPDANNTVNTVMIDELRQVYARAAGLDVNVVVLEGSADVFCYGADFGAIGQAALEGKATSFDPEPLYQLLHQMAFGGMITVAHVRGKVNAGGVGFVAASDVVIADERAVFTLSELLFGLIPAVVLPFLIRRTGLQHAHYLAATTLPISAPRACEWGLVDAYDADSHTLLRRHLLRLSRLSTKAIARYKAYLSELAPMSEGTKRAALNANREVFSDPENLAAIIKYNERGLFPWEESA